LPENTGREFGTVVTGPSQHAASAGRNGDVAVRDDAVTCDVMPSNAVRAPVFGAQGHVSAKIRRSRRGRKERRTSLIAWERRGRAATELVAYLRKGIIDGRT